MRLRRLYEKNFCVNVGKRIILKQNFTKTILNGLLQCEDEF